MKSEARMLSGVQEDAGWAGDRREAPAGRVTCELMESSGLSLVFTTFPLCSLWPSRSSVFGLYSKLQFGIVWMTASASLEISPLISNLEICYEVSVDLGSLILSPALEQITWPCFRPPDGMTRAIEIWGLCTWKREKYIAFFLDEYWFANNKANFTEL